MIGQFHPCRVREARVVAILRSWWGKGLLGAFVVLGLLAALGPKLVARTPLLDWLVQSAAADLDGTMSVGNATLGWFAPVVLENVAIIDRDGRPLLTVARVETSKTLLDLARDTPDLGRIRCDGLVLSIHCSEQQTNLETVLAPLLNRDSHTSAGPRPAVEVHIVQGQVRIEDAPTQRHWQLEDINLTCILPREPTGPVQLEVAGRIDTHTLSANLAATLGATMKGQLQARADAVPLELLGSLLRRVEPSTRLDGELTARVAARWDTGAAEKLHVDGQVSVRNLGLTSRHLGKDRLELAHVDLPCRLHVTDRELHLNRVEVICDVARAAVAGKLSLGENLLDALAVPGWRMTAEADLARLAALLPNTLGLDPDHRITAGQATVEAASTATPSGVAWTANVRTTGLRAIRQGQTIALPEPVSLTLAAHQDRNGGAVLDRFRCDTPFLHLEGAGPFDRLVLSGRADLARLQARVPVTGLHLAGTAELSSQVSLIAHAVQVERIRIVVKDFQGQCPPLHVEEPTVDLSATLHANLRTSRVVLTDTRLVCPAVMIVIPAFAFAPGGDVAVRGTIQGDLGRLQRWLTAAAQPVRGAVTGHFAVHPDSAGTRWEIDLAGQQVVLGSTAAPTWSEPAVRVSGRGIHHGREDRVAVQDLQLQTPALTLAVRGNVDRISTACDLALSGQMHYDLAKLTPPLRTCLGMDLDLAGRGSRVCSLSGPLAGPTMTTPSDPLAQLIGNAGLAWDGARALGCEVGPGEAQLQLRNGWVQSQPIHSTLNRGRLMLSPAVRLAPGPLELHLARGRVLDRAQITPAMCASALGVALPTLSGVAQVSGEVSVDVDGARVPLAGLATADVSGRLTLQGVTLGPGPMVRELSVLLRSPVQGCELRDAIIPVALKDGRVHHRDLQLVFPELTVTTHGSVGLDGSLALVAEFPVPPKWIGADRLGAALSQQLVRVPIGGTLTNPRIDADELARASARILREAARDGLRREVQDSLRRFLPK
jgi:hypothetical protein